MPGDAVADHLAAGLIDVEQPGEDVDPRRHGTDHHVARQGGSRGEAVFVLILDRQFRGSVLQLFLVCDAQANLPR